MVQFDVYADDYDTALESGLAVSGEDKHYFARGRVLLLKRRLAEMGFAPRSVLDYGCGNGTSPPLLLEILGARSVIGLDTSARSLEVARQDQPELPVEYLLTSDYRPSATIDLAFSNGVFHHIDPRERPDVAGFIARCLRPGGMFAFWENNPWNPGTRYVMSKIPFDEDAVMLSARAAGRLLERAGLRVIRTEYHFIFPRALKALRGMEARLSRLPLGAQYQVLCRKDTGPRRTR
jgi:SAM-dependent methyltransferase